MRNLARDIGADVEAIFAGRAPTLHKKAKAPETGLFCFLSLLADCGQNQV
jgi:hypothetical protein